MPVRLSVRTSRRQRLLGAMLFAAAAILPAAPAAFASAVTQTGNAGINGTAGNPGTSGTAGGNATAHQQSSQKSQVYQACLRFLPKVKIPSPLRANNAIVAGSGTET